MAYGLSALACLLAVSWQSECDPRDMAAHDYAKFKMKPQKMMDYVSKPVMMSAVSEGNVLPDGLMGRRNHAILLIPRRMTLTE